MAEEWWAEEWCHAHISIIFLPSIPLPDGYPVEEEDLAQSRQGAKEEENELREPILCVFAPLREILLEPARG